MSEALPEGTDQIVPGAGSNNNRDVDDLKQTIKDTIKGSAGAKAAEFKDQYADKARGYAEQGKERATSGLDSVAKMIGDGAGQIDGAFGEGYGDYVRRAADAVSGFSGQLRDKDVDELIGDARDLVRKSPAIAIGAAAAAGFLIARIIKAGSDALDESAKSASTTKAPSKPAAGKTTAKTTAAKTTAAKPRTPSPKPRSAD